MNDSLDENFADYVPAGRKPLRSERIRARKELESRGADLRLESDPRYGLTGMAHDVEAWWGALRPEDRLAEVANLWDPQFFAAGALAKGGTRFFSFLTKTLEQAVARGEVGGLKFGGPATGNQVLRRLEKLGVSKDELKYTGVRDWLETRGKEPVRGEDLLDFARENELKLKVRELAFNESAEKSEQLDRIVEGQQKLDEVFKNDARRRFVQERRKQGAYPTDPKLLKREIAAEFGIDKLRKKYRQLEVQQPSHGESYYEGGYVLPNKLGLPPAGYRERLYEPNKPEGIDVEFTHRANYPRAFAHSRGEPRDFLLKGQNEEVPGLMVEELQADTHENVGAYLTGDPFKDTKSISKVLGLSMQKNKQPFEYTWEYEGGQANAQLQVKPSPKGGFEATISGRNFYRGEVVDKRTFKTPDELKEGLGAFVEEQGLPTEDLFENIRGIYSESEVRLAADYPFKKDWWKVQVKDWLKLAAEDPNVKVLGLPSGKMMSDRLGFRIWKKGTSTELLSDNILNRARAENRIEKGISGRFEFLAEDMPDTRGNFAYELYEKKVPQWIEEEFGVKLEKGVTETRFPGGQSMFSPSDDVEQVPVWIVPIDQIRDKLKKPMRLSWLSQQEQEGLA